VQELLDGKDLAKVLAAGGPLPVHEAVSWVLQACDATAEAHALGIIHRDLKPSNLFLMQAADGQAMIKVIDFGLAKGTNASPDAIAPASFLTHLGSILGSVGYMAPEQVRSAKDVDERADVYALGVTLYELLTGVRPHVGENAARILVSVLRDPPRPLADVAPYLPHSLVSAVMRTLAVAPADRSTLSEFALSIAPFARSDRAGCEESSMGGRQTARMRVAAPAIGSEPKEPVHVLHSVSQAVTAGETTLVLPVHSVSQAVTPAGTTLVLSPQQRHAGDLAEVREQHGPEMPGTPHRRRDSSWASDAACVLVTLILAAVALGNC
jgi:serine/threonine-protein kinase